MKTIFKKLGWGLLGLTTMLLASCQEDEDAMTVSQPDLRVSITRGGSRLVVPTANNFTVDQGKVKVKIPLGISLSTVTLDTFTVGVSLHPDTASQVISAGAIPNAVLLPADKVTLPAAVTVPANRLSAPLNLVLDFKTLQDNPGKNLVLAVRLRDASRHQLNTAKSTTLIVIDTDAAIEASELGDVTAKYLKNTGPFRRSDSGTGRWGKLLDWTVTSNLLNQSGGNGGFTTDQGGSMQVESANWSGPGVTNGKVYQTTELPKGNYSLEFTLRERGGTINANFVAALGTTLPDMAGLDNPANYLGKVAWTNSSAAPATYKVAFSLAQRSTVSLGLVTTFGTTTYMAISKVVLHKTQ